VSTVLDSKLTSKYVTGCSRNPTKHRSLWGYIECGGKSECCILRNITPRALKVTNEGWRYIGG